MSVFGQVPYFDKDRSFDMLVKQCDFGPRVPGTPEHKQCLDFLTTTMEQYADQVITQPFMFSFGVPAKTVTAYNVYAKFQPQKANRILLCAHWDSRPWADQDPDKKNHNKPVIGANDGASGVAVLLEIARLLHEQPPAVGVDIVFFDAEDAGQYNDESSWAVGSQKFVQEFSNELYPRYGILLDLVGDADLQVYQEAYSAQVAGAIVNHVWQMASNLGLSNFIPSVKFSVNDDHIAFLRAGIPCIDIIDFEYPYWHTISDTPDKCSPESLGSMGLLLTHLIYSEK